jgi:hypothetical protein
MPATEISLTLTRRQEELLKQIRTWWKKNAPKAKIPEGTWVDQVEGYSQVMIHSIKSGLRRLRSNAKVALTSSTDSEIDAIKEELEILSKCQDILFPFVRQFSDSNEFQAQMIVR